MHQRGTPATSLGDFIACMTFGRSSCFPLQATPGFSPKSANRSSSDGALQLAYGYQAVRATPDRKLELPLSVQEISAGKIFLSQPRVVTENVTDTTAMLDFGPSMSVNNDEGLRHCHHHASRLISRA
jgi:hypothetical protein